MLTCFIYQICLYFGSAFFFVCLDMFVIAVQDHFSFFCFGNVSFLVTTFGVGSQTAHCPQFPHTLTTAMSYSLKELHYSYNSILCFKTTIIYLFIFFWWRWDIVDDCFILCFILCSVS